MFNLTIFRLFLLLLLAVYTLLFASNELVFTDDLIKQSFLLENLSLNKVQELIDFRNNWNWVNYVLLPFILISKLSLISLWILSGSILVNLRVSFKEVFRVVLVAEFIWLIPSFISFIWLGIISSSFTLQSIQYFQPLSLLRFFHAPSLESWIIFPLKSINLFELVYTILLAIGIMRVINSSFSKALKFILPVYGSALVTWIIFVTFLSINLGVQ